MTRSRVPLLVFAFAGGMVCMAGMGSFLGEHAGAAEEQPALEIEYINPSPMGFTNVVGVKAGGVRTLYVSGQVGFGEGGIPEDMAGQADLAFKNIVAQLDAAGATTADVVKLNVYVKDMNAAALTAIGAAEEKYFTHKDKPASTWVGVTGLVYPQLLLEVEAIAVMEDG